MYVYTWVSPCIDTAFLFKGIMEVLFFVNAVLLGVGLAMDAFSVSLADGLNDPNMSKGKGLCISSIFGLFQFLMPLIGWILVHTLVTYFETFNKFVPYIALILLVYIGGKMVYEANHLDPSGERKKLTFTVLLVQGIATSIDALSVGFTIADYTLVEALIECLIIGLVTLIICLIGLKLGKLFGTKFEKQANYIGGIILILIGIEIFVKGVFF